MGLTRVRANGAEVATAAGKYKPDVVALLREIPGQFDEADVRRRVLGVLAERLGRDRRQTDHVAYSLYQLALADQLDGDRILRVARWAWDALDLSDAGYTEEARENIVDELIAASREAAPAELRQADLASPERY